MMACMYSHTSMLSPPLFLVLGILSPLFSGQQSPIHSSKPSKMSSIHSPASLLQWPLASSTSHQTAPLYTVRSLWNGCTSDCKEHELWNQTHWFQSYSLTSTLDLMQKRVTFKTQVPQIYYGNNCMETWLNLHGMFEMRTEYHSICKVISR